MLTLAEMRISIISTDMVMILYFAKVFLSNLIRKTIEKYNIITISVEIIEIRISASDSKERSP